MCACIMRVCPMLLVLRNQDCVGHGFSLSTLFEAKSSVHCYACQASRLQLPDTLLSLPLSHPAMGTLHLTYIDSVPSPQS